MSLVRNITVLSSILGGYMYSSGVLYIFEAIFRDCDAVKVLPADRRNGSAT